MACRLRLNVRRARYGVPSFAATISARHSVPYGATGSKIT